MSIRVEGLPASWAHRAIDAAFGEVAKVHRLMSFHEAASDVSRLNREASRRPVEVHPYTVEVLRWAMDISTHSGGCFDISVGAELVEWGMLPRPAGASCPPQGCWRDIELCPDGRVAFHRALWIDLGGIAKGYAVDRATACLREWGATHAVVNAGGDLRVLGQRVERIGLELELPMDPMPILDVTDGSVASSSGHRHRRRHCGRVCGPHVDGNHRSPAPTERFVCVAAEECVVADAMTKVVMTKGPDSLDMLLQFGAVAHMCDARDGWRHLGKAELP